MANFLTLYTVSWFGGKYNEKDVQREYYQRRTCEETNLFKNFMLFSQLLFSPLDVTFPYLISDPLLALGIFPLEISDYIHKYLYYTIHLYC